jgi:pilus assembly protein TadC
MRRFLLFVVVSCIAALVVRSLWPSQLADYLALFHQHSSVNSGVVVTALGLLPLLLAVLWVRRWRSERELARLRRELDRRRREQAPPELAAYPPAPSAPWEASAWR